LGVGEEEELWAPLVRGKRLGSWDTAGEWTRVMISSSDLHKLLSL